MRFAIPLIHARLGLVLLITSSCQQPVEQVFLIPDGYVGPVIIVFDDQAGTPVEYQGAERIYRIPKNGVLKTQFPTVRGLIDNEYFYVNLDHRTKRLVYAEDLRVAMPNDTMVYGGGVSSGGRRLGSKGNAIETLPSLVLFVVGPVSQADRLIRDMENLLMKQ